MTDERTLLELSRADGLRLIASVPVGRLVFTQHALPAIRPVNHIVEDDMLVIGLTAGSSIAASARGGIVVAYEADSLDVTERSGWSVVVVGVARLETDATTVLRYRDQLQPWLSGAMADILTISSELVTGYRLVPQPPSAAGITARPRVRASATTTAIRTIGISTMSRHEAASRPAGAGREAAGLFTACSGQLVLA